MAGIFANVDSDISKLRQLKAEIEGIKKALKSINVKVDIDIAKGMEEQLRSLTAQYDALVQKVSQAEGKIIASTRRINEAAERIAKAQGELANATGARPQTGSSSGTGTSANQAETASVEAQAKAYDELEREINDILGTREANIKRMMEERTAIRLINEEIKKLEKLQGSSSSATIQDRIARLNNDLLTHKTALSEVRQALANNAKMDNAAATSMNALSQSLSRMRIAYRELTEEERNSPFGQELLASIQQADARIKQLDASIGNHQRNVGNYASGWNGLSMSIQQIGRELPSLAMGWNTFFLAISNNLPILADEIKRARVEYDNLKKSGQTAIPVWRQVVTSLVSWQTALTVGITLLTMYGDEIIDWVGSLFMAKKALSETYEANEEFQKSVSQSSGRLLATIERLSAGWVKLGGDIEAQRKYILDNKEAFDSTGIAVRDVADAENLLVTNKDSFVKALQDKAKATAIMELASKEYEKYIQKMLEADSRATEGPTFMDRLKSNFARTFSGFDTSGNLMGQDLSPEAFAKDAVKDLEDDAEEYRKSSVNLIEKFLGLDERSREEIEKAGGELTDTLVDGSVEAIERAISQRREALKKVTSREDYAKIEAEIEAYQRKLNAITGGGRKREKSGRYERPLTIDIPDEKVTLITPEEIQESINLHREAMNQYLKDYGTYQERRKAIADSYSMRIDEAETEGERLSLQKKMEEELAGLDLERLKKGINWELIFGDLSHVTREELDKVKAQLDEFRQSKEYKNLSIDQKETVEKALNDIKSTMIDNGGLLGDLPTQLDELRKAQEELTAAQDEYNEAMKSGTDAQKEVAQDKLNAAKNREANAQRNVSLATDKTIHNITTLSRVIAELGSSSEMSMTDMGNMVEQVASLFGEMGSKVGGIIGAALSLIDVIQKQGMENFVMNMGKMGNDLARETTEFFTFGLLDLGGLSNRNVDSDVERLTTSNEELVAALDRLRERMDDASVADSTGIYNLQIENLRQQERNYRQMMQEYGSVHDDGFLGMFGSHSSFYKVDEEMSANEWRRISGIVGKTIDSAGDFFNLTSEQMALVADNATDLYAKIKQYADDGVRDAAQYMDDYIQIYKEIEEIQDAYKEKLTSVSFDSVKDDFRSALLDMEDSTEAFADNFEEMMKNAILESMMTGTYDKRLREWYESFSSAMEGGELTEREQESLRNQWESIVGDASDEWQSWKDLMGWGDKESSSSQGQPTAGGFETMSQDSADELNGRFTSLQMSAEEIKAMMRDDSLAITDLKGSISGLVAVMQDGRGIADETRTILVNSYMELQEIRDNTGDSARYLKDIKADIAEMKRNTDRI